MPLSTLGCITFSQVVQHAFGGTLSLPRFFLCLTTQLSLKDRIPVGVCRLIAADLRIAFFESAQKFFPLPGIDLVCTENLIRFDLMTESLTVGRDGRADIFPLEPGRLDLQAQERT
jgi:hypothetical protein